MKDEVRFRQWWEKLSPELRRSIASIVGADSIDILQDVSVMAIQRFDDFPDYESFRRWSYIRGKWLALDELAKRKRQVEGPPLSPACSTDDRLILSEELRQMIKQLPSRQRQVTEDRLQGYTSDEIARRMSIAPTSVRSLWRFAKQNLIKAIEDND